MNAIETINPATEEVISSYPYFSDQKIQDIIQAGNNSWNEWKSTSFVERSRLFKRMSTLLKERKEQLAEQITNEMGKPLGQAEAEIEKCAWVCDYYAVNAEGFLQNEVIKSDATKSYVKYDPLGIVFAVMPWNFPYWQVFRFAAPALMAGNAGLLKHAPNTTGCALSIEQLFKDAGFPDHLFSTIVADIPQIEAIVANDNIAAVTLTGSSRAGKSLAALAGKYLKKIVLELGGSDPYLVLEDADLETAAEACITGRLLNSGQSCIAAKRFIVTAGIFPAFSKLIAQKLSEKIVGDPKGKETDVGPIARADLRKGLDKQVKESIAKGANCILGGKIDSRKGYYYPVTLLTNVTKGSPAYQEELFGPVAVIISVDDEEEAVKVANDTSYGLGSAVFSEDISRAEMVASKINAGSTFVNSFVKSDPRLPFGGIKQSGFGRELSAHGIKEFVNIKTIYLK